MNNTVITGKLLEQSNEELFLHIRNFIDSIEKKKYSLVADDGVYSLGWLDSFRLFLDQYDINSSPAKKMIATSLYRMNRTCPWAIPLYFKAFLENEVPDLKTPVRVKSTDLISGLNRIKDQFISDNIESLYTGILEAGATGSITVEHHEDLVPSVETHEGFKTLVKLNSFFYGTLKNCEIKSCKIIVVNGAIIEVSEIHHLLEYAYNTKRNIMLIAGSFSDDVSNTLLVNWQNGNTKVIPFVLPDSLETINESKDICTALDITPISNENGLRISSIDIEDYPDNDVHYNGDKDVLRILLTESGSLRSQKLKLDLQKKYEEEKVEDIKNVLSDRITRLSGRNTSINIRFSDSSKGLIEDRAGALFSYFSRCARQNVMDMGKNYFVNYLPAEDAKRAYMMGISDRESLDKIRAIIRIDSEENRS
jgi:hypothetical protein